MKKAFVLLALAAGLSSFAQAQSVAVWDFTGDTGSQVSEAAVNLATGITNATVTRGAGLGSNAGLNSFNSNGWESTTSGPGSSEYLSFGFTVAEGYTVDLSNLLITTRASASGPGTLVLVGSSSRFASTLYTFAQGSGTDLFSSVDLTAMPLRTGDVEFRMYELGNRRADGTGLTTAAGTLRLTSMAFTGSVSAVPEPETYAMLLAGLGLVGAYTRRHKAQASQA